MESKYLINTVRLCIKQLNDESSTLLASQASRGLPRLSCLKRYFKFSIFRTMLNYMHKEARDILMDNIVHGNAAYKLYFIYNCITCYLSLEFKFYLSSKDKTIFMRYWNMILTFTLNLFEMSNGFIEKDWEKHVFTLVNCFLIRPWHSS